MTQLNTRQAWVLKFANLLGAGKPASAADIITSLECSEPALTRALRELREPYSTEIKYSKVGHSYYLVNLGQLGKKTLRRMNEALAQNAELEIGESTGKVVLDKDKKIAASLSPHMRTPRKTDRLAVLSGSTRSEAVEKLALHSVDELIKEYSTKKP